MSSNQAHIVALIGSSGSGKSLWLKRELPTMRPPVLVWDIMREYHGPGMHAYSTLAGVIDALKAGRDVLVFHPNRGDEKQMAAEFAMFCRIAYARGNCTLIAEELMYVTKAGWSPAPWLEVVSTGRHRGLRVYGTSQRPALVDKTFFANATVIRCGRLNFKADKAVMADALDVPVLELRALRPLEWIVKDAHSGQVTRETLQAPKSRRRR